MIPFRDSTSDRFSFGRKLRATALRVACLTIALLIIRTRALQIALVFGDFQLFENNVHFKIKITIQRLIADEESIEATLRARQLGVGRETSIYTCSRRSLWNDDARCVQA